MTINLTDPANHPANSPLPVQRIERVIEALERSLKYRNGSSMDHALADAVKGLRELRDVRKAKPVTLSVWYGAMPESNGRENWTAILHRKGDHPWEGIMIDRSEYPGRALYEADRMRFLIGEIDAEPDILAYDSETHSGYAEKLNQPVSETETLPSGYLQGHQDALEWAAQMAEANHPQTGDWLYDDPIALAAAIRKGPDMPLASGNSPVTPDGWVMVPVEPTETMIINGFESEPDEFFSESRDWEAYQEMSGCEQAAHRAKLCYAAMLSAAPKEVGDASC